MFHMSVPYRITVRISEETMEKLVELVDMYRYESISDLIRKAIDDLLEKNYGPRKRNVEMLKAKEILRTVDDEIDKNESISLEDLLELVIREYTYRVLGGEIRDITTNASVKRKKGGRSR